MEKVFDLKEVINGVTDSASNNVEDVRFIKKMEVGQVVRHGDLYYNFVGEYGTEYPHGALLQSNQLASGTSAGSRHIAEAPAKCYVGTKLPDYYNDTAFIGPYFESKERFVVSHPEHSSIHFPSGNYMVSFQLDARTLQKVKD